MPPSEKKKPTGDYTIGYARPPKANQYKPAHLRDGSRKANQIDAAKLLDAPLRYLRDGKPVSIHTHEAGLRTSAKVALDRKSTPAASFRAIKSFLKQCEIAGMFEAPPSRQPSNVFTVTPDMNNAIVRVLLETYGLPPWDPKIYAELEAENARDRKLVAELYRQHMRSIGEPE